MANPLHQVSAQGNFFVDQLLEWADPLGGTAIWVPTLKDMWAQASTNSQIPTIYVTWMGEDPFSSNAQIAALTHRVDRKWVIGIKRGRGFSANRGDTQIKTVGNVDPFIDQVEEVRDLMRSWLGVSESYGNDYGGIKPWAQGTQVVDGFLIYFSTKNDLPPIVQITGQ